VRWARSQGRRSEGGAEPGGGSRARGEKKGSEGSRGRGWVRSRPFSEASGASAHPGQQKARMCPKLLVPAPSIHIIHRRGVIREDVERRKQQQRTEKEEQRRLPQILVLIHVRHDRVSNGEVQLLFAFGNKVCRRGCKWPAQLEGEQQSIARTRERAGDRVCIKPDD